MSDEAALLPGTLDLLILKALSLGPQHGYGVLVRIGQISKGVLAVEQGALYPALQRLERQGLLTSEWGRSDNNRRAKFYELTALGRRRLARQTDDWNRLVAVMGTVLRARPRERVCSRQSREISSEKCEYRCSRGARSAATTGMDLRPWL